MKHRKLVGWGLVSVFVAMILIIIFQTSLTIETYDNLELLVGIGLWVFGVWASIILLKK